MFPNEMDKPSLPPVLAFALVTSFAGGCDTVETRSIDRFTQTGELVALSGGRAGAANACFTCHGLDGRGNGAGAPRLAGLDAGYLERQLIAYADGLRRHPEMEWIAKRLSSQSRGAVAHYYASMRFETRPATATERLGRTIYLRGDPQRGIPACAGCHGPDGQGIGPANPPLAGQPASYLEEQIHTWRLGERRTDPGNVMMVISRRLTDRQAAAVSAYAAALPGGLPHPEFREAFPEVRRDDPRSGA